MDDDSAETITAGVTLGLQHPPGYPTDALLTHLASLAPLGNHCFRINLLSALLASLGVLLLAINIFLLLKIFEKNQKSPLGKWPLIFCASAGGLLLAFSKTYWEKALGAKGSIYLLQTVILLAVLYCLIRHESAPPGKNPKRDNNGSSKWFYSAFFIFAAGFTNHWETQIVFLPFLLFFGVQTERRKATLQIPGLKSLSSFLSFGLLGVSPLLYLPLRAHLYPVLNLGAPDNLVNFTADIFRKYVSGREAGLLDTFFHYLEGTSNYQQLSDLFFSIVDRQGRHISAHFWEDLKGPALFFAAWGLWYWRRTSQNKLLLVLLLPFLLLLSALCSKSWIPAGLTGRWYMDNFLLPGNWIVALLAAVGFYSLGNKLSNLGNGPFPRILMALLLFVVPLHLCLFNYQAIDEEKQVLRFDYGANLLKSIPKNSIFFSEAEEDYFPLYYFQNVEVKRLDVKMIPTFILFETWGVRQIQDLYPTLGLTAASGDFPGQIARLTFATSEIIEKNLNHNPIFFSYFDGALHRFYLSSHPSLLFRKSGVIFEFASPEAPRGQWLDYGQLRTRHFMDCPSNNHESLKGILRVYQGLGVGS